jgi:pantoate--beta-alanine ligase
MGALHQGHMSLVEQSAKENDITVVSIFVNPTQFNQKDDLDKYPRDLHKDSMLLKRHGCDYLFAPLDSQIYPPDLNTNVYIDIVHLTDLMEGPNRPGHFEGVVQVVKRLLDIVEPDRLYMGQKDYQQFTIIQYVLKGLEIDVKLRVIPIMREKDGLAMSSRNVRLTPEYRDKGTVIHETLQWAKSQITNSPISEIEQKAMEKIKNEGLKPEYFSIVDGHKLTPVSDISQHSIIVACTAAWAGEVRLIDNMILRGEINI